MANSVLVLTKSGFGKSTSYGNIPELGIEGLNPKETLLINVKGKPLPFRGWRKHYSPITDDKAPYNDNYLESTNHAEIIKTMNWFNINRLDVHNVVLDDAQYLMAEEFMANALKAGYDKFNKLGKNMYDVLNAGIKLRKNINFFVLAHEEEAANGYKMKTIGKMLDEKVTLEGLFTILLYGRSTFDATTKTVKKEFVTNEDGTYPAKTPVGMFKELYIPNDLGIVARTMNEYYNGEEA